jgi:hypothetical protein
MTLKFGICTASIGWLLATLKIRCVFWPLEIFSFVLLVLFYYYYF